MSSHNGNLHPVKQDPGTSARTNGNSHFGQKEPEPIFAPRQKEAVAVVRLILGYKVSDKTRRSFSPEWNDLAEFVEASKGLTRHSLYERVLSQFLASLKARRPEQSRMLQDALAVAWNRAQEEDPGDEKSNGGLEEARERRPFLGSVLGATAFNRAEFKLKWLIKRILVANQPAVVGAPKKSMKTSMMVDMAVSLASGTPFLGTFEISEAAPVLLLSGESGGFTLQETVRRVCKAKGLEVESLEGKLFIGDELPQLGNEEDLENLTQYLRSASIRAVIIDPLYLCLLQGTPGRRLDPSNLFDVGPLLLAVSRACIAAEAAPILVHHFKKNGADPHEMPELEELAYAGIQEFARQWILLKRRKRFEPGSGLHHLWLTVGGSAGHSGDWAVDITEGIMDEDFQGRRWEVSVKIASEARKEETAGKSASKAEQAAERVRENDEVKSKKIRDDAVSAMLMLEELYKKWGSPQTQRTWRESLGWSGDRIKFAVAWLKEHNWIEEKEFVMTIKGRGNRNEAGFVPVKIDTGTAGQLRDNCGTTVSCPGVAVDCGTAGQGGVSSPVGGDTIPPSRSHPGTDAVWHMPVTGDATTHKRPGVDRPASGEEAY